MKWNVRTNQFEIGRVDTHLPIRVFDSLEEALSTIRLEEENCLMHETWIEETEDKATYDIIGYYLYFENDLNKPTLERQYYFDPIDDQSITEGDIKKMTFFERRLAESLQNPEFKKEWENSEQEYNELAQSLKEMQQIRKGEMKAKSWDDFLAEMDSEDEQ